MLRAGIITSSLLLLLAGPLLAQPKQANITGFAYDRKTGELLYTENHALQLQGMKILEHKVLYKDPQQKVFCEKWLDYAKHSFAPAFQLTDMRDGYIEGAQHQDGSYRLYSRDSNNSEFEYKTVPLQANLVSDSGFDLFVRARMDQLLKEKAQRFQMAVASEQAVLSFQAELLGLFDRSAIRIKVQPSTLLRLLVDPIFLTYDIENGELLRYEGLSNIRDENGNRYDTRIDFPPEQQQYAGIRRVQSAPDD